MQKKFLKKILLWAGGIFFVSIQNSVAQINTSAITSLNKISAINKNWQQGGIFDGKTPQEEILVARTGNTKKFIREDGLIDILFGGPFHYQDERGAWQDIDLNIKQSYSEIYGFVNEDNKFISRFARNPNAGVKMEYKNKIIEFGINSSVTADNWSLPLSANSKASANGNTLTYKNIFSDVDLEYEISTGAMLHRMKFMNKNIFLSITNQDFIDIEEEIHLPLNAILVDSLGEIKSNRSTVGSVYIVVLGDTVFTILPSRIWDASFTGDVFAFQSNNTAIIFTPTSIDFLDNNKIKYTAKIPVRWLLAPNRAWPIIFDPTVPIGGNGTLTYGSGGWGYRYPWRTNYWQLVNQTIYTQSEIGYTGDITSVAYRQGVNNGLVNSNARIRLQTTNNTTFPSTNFVTTGWPSTPNWTGTPDYTLGSGGNVNCSNPQPIWQTINLTTPFNYSNSTQNLIIETRFQNTSSSGDGNTCGGLPGSCCIGGGWYYYDRTGTVSVHGTCDCSSTYPTPLTTYNYRSPVMRITINPTCTGSSIITQPSNQTAPVGGSAIFSVAVSGTAPITYQWQLSTNGGATYNPLSNGGVYSNVTTATLNITGALLSMNTYRYRCFVSNTCGNATSNAGILTVSAGCVAPAITSQPVNQTISVGQNTSFSVAASGTSLTYQWQVSTNGGATYNPLSNGGVYSNVTVATMNITGALLSMNTYRYRCFVSNTCGNATSNAGILTVSAGCVAPSITSQPVNQTVSVGQNTSFSVAASGTSLTYQWQVSTNGGATYNPLSNGGVYSNVTVATMNITSALLSMNTYRYRCFVSNTCGNATSSVAILTVTSNNNLVIDYSINAIVIPPWQRQNDDYDGKITVIRTGNVNAPWHLEVDVHNSSGTIVEHTIQYSSITTSVQFFNTATDISLKNYSVEGKIMAYYAVLDNSVPLIRRKVVGTNVNVNNGLTYINQKKWNNITKTFVSHQGTTDQLVLPVKWVNGSVPTHVFFQRSGSTSKKMVTNINFPYFHIVTPPTITHTLLLSQFPVASDGYCYINASNSNIELAEILPGQFEYFVYSNATQLESAKFDLVKIGKVKNNNSNKVMLMIGGLYNEIQLNAEDIINSPNANWSNSDRSFSIVPFVSNSGFDVWYVGQANANSVKRNGYSIAKAIERILQINPNYSEIDIICHSKGGLDVRALLGSTPLNSNQLLDKQNDTDFNFAACSFNQKVKKVCFLGSPHKGARLANWFTDGLLGSPAITDVRENSQILNLLNSTGMPSTVQFANLTGFRNFTNDMSDFVVPVSSSEYPFIGQGRTAIQMYQRDYVSSIWPFHLRLHKTNNLGNHHPQDCTTDDANKDKIFKFFNSSYDLACSGYYQNYNPYLFIVSGSKMPGAIVYINKTPNGTFEVIDVTDENSMVNMLQRTQITIGDSIKVIANGYEDLVFSMNALSKLPIPMIKRTAANPNDVLKPSLKLINQDVITSQQLTNLEITGENISQYLINQHSSESVFVPLLVSNGIASISLDTGYNLVIVKFIGRDTIVQIKEIYYLPGTHMIEYSRDLNIICANSYLGSKMYVNNVFYKDIKNTTTSVKILKGFNEIKFTKFGYKDAVIFVDTTASINLTMQSYSYSSINDSVLMNNFKSINPQYWKTITVKNNSSAGVSQIVLKQSDDAFAGMSLKPQTRKFVFRKHGSAAPASFKAAIALDQINTPNKDSVYLLYKNGKDWVKYPANLNSVSEYDPEVQKIAFDKLYIDDNETRELVLMQKQAPIMKALDTIWHSGQTIAFPLSIFVDDPDSIKNDLGIFSNDVKVSVIGNIVYITAPVNFTGTTTYTLSGTHDFLDESKTYIMKVIAPEVYIPNAFTPNRDGLNDVIRPIFLGKLKSCHFTIFNRNGQKVYETTDCAGGWDGRLKGAVQDPGTYVWMLTYQFEGEGKKEVKGTVTLIR